MLTIAGGILLAFVIFGGLRLVLDLFNLIVRR